MPAFAAHKHMPSAEKNLFIGFSSADCMCGSVRPFFITRSADADKGASRVKIMGQTRESANSGSMSVMGISRQLHGYRPDLTTLLLRTSTRISSWVKTFKWPKPPLIGPGTCGAIVSNWPLTVTSER